MDRGISPLGAGPVNMAKPDFLMPSDGNADATSELISQLSHGLDSGHN